MLKITVWLAGLLVCLLSVSGCEKVAGLFGAKPAVVNTPAPIVFSSELQAPLGRYIYSDVAIVRNAQAPVMVSIAKGELSVDGGAFTSEPQRVESGQTLRIRVQSAEDFNVTTTAVLQVGSVLAEFKVRTQTEEFVIETERNLFDQLPNDKWAVFRSSQAVCV